MDWTQASQLELIVFGEGVFATCLLLVGIVGALAWCVYAIAREKVAHIKRRRMTTRALRCDVCDFNVEGVGDGARKCERFGHSITGAPVRRPGCSWGMRWKEGGDD